MPGTFSKTARPKLPGAYVNFEALPQSSVPPSVGSVVAIPFTHDWGPMDRAVRVDSLGEFKSVYGPSEDTPGYKAVKQAFQGEGVTGRGGAGQVVAVRIGGSAAAKSSRVLQNTTPAAALTLTALYEGTYGDDLRVTIQDYASDAAKDELILLLGSVELERYVYANTDVNDLAAQINATSEWVSAVANISGVALGTIANAAFTAGNDGGTLVAGDWTAMLTLLEVERFSVFAPFDMTDTGIVASIKAWAQTLNTQGKRFMTVLGGALNETVTTAVTRAASLNDENFVTVGVGSVEDDELGILSTSQLAPRIAGVIAQRGEAMSLTYARLAGLTIVVGPSLANVLTAYDGGVVVLGRDSNVEAPVRIEKGVTTYTTTSNVQKPKTIFSDPKFVRTMQALEGEITEWAETYVIGQLQVNQKTREAVIGEMMARLKRREELGVIQAGWSVEVDRNPAPSDDDTFIALLYGIKFGRSVEQVFNTIRVG